MDVAIIGGAGHVGLPLGLILADTGYSVTLVDKDREKLDTLLSGEMPFAEEGGQEYLERALADNSIFGTTEISAVTDHNVIIVVIGTPIDEHRNPQMDDFLELVDDVCTHSTEEQLLIFRSTVYPGTTSIVRDRLEDDGYSVGEDIFVSFAPERIAQHRAFEEVVELPQLIGAFDDESYGRTETLFESFLKADCYRLNPTEAELGKLFTNMWRYLTFAAANEFHLITESFATHHDVNVHRILDRTSRNYPRFDTPSPGANVGGPCLTKDGWFLVDDIPFDEFVSTAYRINEGMPSQIIERMARMAPNPDRITVLGMTFKANSDDTRNSVSFKMTKQLQRKGYDDVIEIEPNVDRFDPMEDVEGSDWVILMTPHDEFEDLESIRSQVDNRECLYCDIWGHWDEMKYRSENGYFFGHQVEQVDTEMDGVTQ